MFKNKLNYKLLNLLMLSVIIYLCIQTFNWWGGIVSKIFSILLPFLIAFVIAYAIYPCVRSLQKKGIRKSIAITFIILLAICVIVLLIYVTVPLVYEQLISLSKLLTNFIGTISTKFKLNLGNFEDTINLSLNKLISGVGEYVSNGAFDFVSRSIDILTKTIIVVIVSIYFLIDMDKIRQKVKLLLKRINNRAFLYVKCIDNELLNYLEGLVIFMGIQLVEYSLLFFLIGHPNWLLLGILASLTTVIPYFGGIATNIIAVILASAVSTKLFILTAIICLVFPNIDGYIISPKVYGKTNDTNPVWTIFAVFAGGALYGFLGIVIALPLYIVLKVSYNFFKDDIYGKQKIIK